MTEVRSPIFGKDTTRGLGSPRFHEKADSFALSPSKGVETHRELPSRDDEIICDRVADNDIGDDSSNSKLLALVFASMVLVGSTNKVLSKLMTIPMYNYPNFLTLLSTFVYIPVCFAYVIPMAHFGFLSSEQFEVPKKSFAIIGALDAIVSVVQTFGATYLPGPLVILLRQAVIPVSMAISKVLLKTSYSRFQYIGALIVAIGILIVLVPTLSGTQNNSLVWSVALLLNSVPMALSSIYKEIAMGKTEMDPMYLNGWVAVFQFAFALMFAIPSALVSDPPVEMADLPQNLWNGMKCYAGINSKSCDPQDSNCVPDDCFPRSIALVNSYLVVNQVYNLVMVLMLKYGSANLLFLALTLMVPLGNVTFTLPFIPGHGPLRSADIAGLVVICIGLACYQFASQVFSRFCQSEQKHSYQEVELPPVQMDVEEDHASLQVHMRDADDEVLL